MRKSIEVIAVVALAALVSWPQAQNLGTWTKYRTVTINTTPAGGGADVAGTVEDFPVLVRLTDASNATGADVLSEALAGGADIRFTNATGTVLLPHEIDHWSPTSAAIWVKVPSVAGNANTAIRIYWSRPGTPSASDGNAVFPASNGYTGVWHMGGSDGPRPNATVGGPDAVPSLGAESGTFAGRSRPGHIGLADSLQGASSPAGEYFDVSPMPGFGNGFTFSAWTYITSTTGRSWMRIFDFGNGEGLDNIFFGRQDASSTLLFDVFPGQIISDENGIVTGEWRYLTTTISASDDVTSVNATHLYVNGMQVAAGEASYEDVVRTSSFVGRSNWADATFTGYLDEVRVSEVERSADWIKLNFETQKAMATAVTLGATQAQTVKVMYYGEQTPTYLVNAAISPNTPVVSGTATAYAVSSGTLPAGLTLDATTGVISGSPTTVAAQTQLVITGTVNGNPALDTLRITVSAGDPPGAPTNVTAVRGNTQVTVSWTAPASSGTLPVTSYLVRATSDAAKGCDWTTGDLTCTVTGLTNGTPYSFTVRAVSDVGPGALSESSAPVTPAGLPGAPTAVKVVLLSGGGQNATATVSWTAPTADGGAPLAGTYVFGDPSGNCFAPAPGTSCVVTGLAYDTPYTFRATASNGVGIGDTSAASEAFTPVAILPGSFVLQTTGSAQPFTFVLSQDAINSTEAFTMTISDVWGRTVWARTVHPARDGSRELIWNSRNTKGKVVASGLYVMRVTTRNGAKAATFVESAIKR